MADLKHNRRLIVRDTLEELLPLTKAIRSLKATDSNQSEEPLNVPYKDILDAEQRGRLYLDGPRCIDCLLFISASSGRWWIVGASWTGRDKDMSAAPEPAESTVQKYQMILNMRE